MTGRIQEDPCYRNAWAMMMMMMMMMMMSKVNGNDLFFLHTFFSCELDNEKCPLIYFLVIPGKFNTEKPIKYILELARYFFSSLDNFSVRKYKL